MASKQCHRSINRFVSPTADPLQFILPGNFQITGYISPTNEYPNGLTIKGKSTITKIYGTGRKFDGELEMYENNKLKFTEKCDTQYIVDNKRRIYRSAYTYVNNKLIYYQNGVAINIKDNTIFFDCQGSNSKTGTHYENLIITYSNVDDTTFEFKLFININDNSELEYLKFKLIK